MVSSKYLRLVRKVKLWTVHGAAALSRTSGMAPWLVRSVMLVVPRSGVCRGSFGRPTHVE